MARAILGMMLICMAQGVWAAPPPAARLFPAGGQRGQTITTATLVGEATMPWPVQVWTSDKDLNFTAEQEIGKFRVDIAPDAVPGVRLVRLFNADGATPPMAFVVGLLPDLMEIEPNDQPTRPQPISPAATVVNGRLATIGDVDVFAVELRAGQTLVAQCDAERPLGSPMDGILQLLSADGFVLAQDNDTHGLDPRLVFTAERAGIYLVRLFAWPSVPNTAIRLSGGEKYLYRLTLTTGGMFDHVFPLSAQQGSPVEVELCGWNLTEADRRLTIPVPKDRDHVWVHLPGVAGHARLEIVTHPSAVEVEPNDAAHPQAVSWPITMNGRIDSSSDVDVLAFEGKKKERVRLRVESRELGFRMDPVLKVTDSTGKLLVTQDDAAPANRDVELIFTPPVAGTYRASVQDLYGHFGPQHVYRLTIGPVEVDYSLAPTLGEITVACGQSIDVPITVSRRNEFAEEIEVAIAGLPADARCDPVRSLAKGDTAKQVKLVIKAGAEAFAGPVTIIGRSTGPASLEREAQTRVGGTDLRISPWLTIVKP